MPVNRKYIRFLELSAVGDKYRTEAESFEFAEIRRSLLANVDEIFGEFKVLQEIEDYDMARVMTLIENLDDHRTKALDLPENITDTFINTVALPHLHAAQTSVMGGLEVLEKLFYRWDREITRCENIVKLIYQFDSAWKSEAALDMILPPDIRSKLILLQTAKDAYATRSQLLHKSFSVISRIVTMRTSTPTKQITRLEPFYTEPAPR